MIATIKTVIKKEWRDSIRDRRSMTAAVMFSIFGPVLIAVMISVAAERETSSKPFKVHVQGAEYANDLSAFLQRNKVEFASEEDEKRVELRIPEDYAERFTAGSAVTLKLAADQSKNKSRREARRLQGLIQSYSAGLGQTRLALRGVASSVVQPIRVDLEDLATREGKASNILGVLVIYYLLAAFIGSLAVSIDVSAGERERNSLEVLMAQPVSSTAVFAGKTGVAAIYGAIGIALTIVISKLVFVKVPLAKIGMTWTMSWVDAGQVLLGLLPLAAMVAALQIGLAMLAKTYKEASTYLNMLSFVPAAVAMVVLIQEVDAEDWMYGVPLLGHQQMLRTMIRAESLDPMLVGMLSFVTLAFTLLLIYAGGKMLTRERIIFGQSD